MQNIERADLILLLSLFVINLFVFFVTRNPRRWPHLLTLIVFFITAFSMWLLPKSWQTQYLASLLIAVTGLIESFVLGVLWRRAGRKD